MAAPAQGPVVHQDDVGEWMGRVKEVVNKPDVLSAPRPAGASKWHFDFFGCFDPIDTCELHESSTQASLIRIRLNHLLLPLRHLWQDSSSSPKGCQHEGL